MLNTETLRLQDVMDRKEHGQRIWKRFIEVASGTKKIIGVLEKDETKKKIKIEIRKVVKEHVLVFLYVRTSVVR